MYGSPARRAASIDPAGRAWILERLAAIFLAVGLTRLLSLFQAGRPARVRRPSGRFAALWPLLFALAAAATASTIRIVVLRGAPLTDDEVRAALDGRGAAWSKTWTFPKELPK